MTHFRSPFVARFRLLKVLLNGLFAAIFSVATAPAGAFDGDEPLPRFYVHLMPAVGDPCDVLDRTFHASDVRSSGNSATRQYAVVLLGGVDEFIGLRFGVEYDTDVEVVEWHPCWDTMEIGSIGFPSSESGIAQLWGFCISIPEDTLIPVGVFELEVGSWGMFRTAGYTYENPASVESCDRPPVEIEVLVPEDHGDVRVHDPFSIGARLARY